MKGLVVVIGLVILWGVSCQNGCVVVGPCWVVVVGLVIVWGGSCENDVL